MSALIRNRRLENDDAPLLADDAPLPASGKIIVSLARWTTEAEALAASGLSVGVLVPNTADIAEVWPQLKDRPLIALAFPAFGDGRAYSQARLLRQRYDYRGELRATGAAVVRDQLFGMQRCGFDSFALRADQDTTLCLQAFADFSQSYQGATDSRTPVLVQRRLAQ